MMKISALLVTITATAIFLSGCGRNIEKIQAVHAELEFTGYKVSL